MRHGPAPLRQAFVVVTFLDLPARLVIRARLHSRPSDDVKLRNNSIFPDLPVPGFCQSRCEPESFEASTRSCASRCMRQSSALNLALGLSEETAATPLPPRNITPTAAREIHS